MIFATDLDRTMIFSYKFLDQTPKETVCVEVLEGKEISYMTKQAYDKLQMLKSKESLKIVPVTTRSLTQFARIEAFKNTEYAITSNGGNILYKEKPLDIWAKKVENLKRKDERPQIQKILQNLEDSLDRIPSIVDDVFFFTKVKLDKKEMVRAFLDKELRNTNWNFTIQGIKLYIIPREISKENALEFLMKYLNDSNLITAGDGKLDINFVKMGKIRYIPKNSEILGEIKDLEDYDIVSEGMIGGEEILESL